MTAPPVAIAAAPSRWIPRRTQPADPERVGSLARALSLPAPLCRILVLRGHDDEASARRHLRPSLDDLHDPFLLADMRPAVDRIGRAIEAGETILVHGDYDVDGMCSAALFTRVIRSLGGRVVPFAPHRGRDGYDLGEAGTGAAREAGATLILTADCGILAHDTIRGASEGGMDVVVTDHHQPGSELPGAAVAVVNPRRSDCAYPEKGLSGTGVAFKVCEALLALRGGAREELFWDLDLVALATIADLCPLTGENRILAHAGLKVLARTRRKGLQALMSAAGMAAGARVTAGQVGHVLGPRLNAAGRLDDAALGLGLLLSDSDAEAAVLAARLEDLNRDRQRVDRAMLSEAVDMLQARFDPRNDFGLVLAGQGWHPGVIGIVASRVVERYRRPAILIALGEAGTDARGSGRSVPGFDLVAALGDCAEDLVRHGGHAQAAGLDIRPDRISEFARRFNDRARESLFGTDLTPRVHYDIELPLSDADDALYRYLPYLGPFGIGNPTPVFVAGPIRLASPPRVVGKDHLRMVLEQNGTRLPAIGFRMAAHAEAAGRPGARLEVAYQLQEDDWRGRTRRQARLIDLRPVPAAVSVEDPPRVP